MHGRLNRRRPIVEMNMVPLIDVSLILVIIFMVLTPVLVQHQLTVRLPSSTEGAAGEGEQTISVQIDRRGGITVDGQPIKLSRLEAELMLKMSRASQKTLLVQADKTVPIETVVGVLDVAKRLKVGKLGIGVLQER
jgi:biopolymer transport protein ExbD